jgi:hypothetical protein
MRKYELTEDQRKHFNKFSLYLDAIFGSDGIEWGLYLGDEYFDIEELYGPIPSGQFNRGREKDMPNNDDPGMVFLDTFVSKFIEDNVDDIISHFYCDECDGSGNIRVKYNPENKNLTFDLYVNITLSNNEEHRLTFNDLINAPQPQWGRPYQELKKLQYDEFINKYKSELGNEVEMVYNGGGDDGQIDNDYPDEIIHLGYEIIDVYYSGWENNEGADGSIVINFDEKMVYLTHNGYYGDTDNVHIETIEFV